MTNPAPTISIRLPDASRKSLDKAAKLTRRSRSFLMKEALDRHLTEIVGEQTERITKPYLASLLELSGAGQAETTVRSANEIDQHIKWLRDNG